MEFDRDFFRFLSSSSIIARALQFYILNYVKKAKASLLQNAHSHGKETTV
jgi:hypothetical protein